MAEELREPSLAEASRLAKAELSFYEELGRALDLRRDRFDSGIHGPKTGLSRQATRLLGAVIVCIKSAE